MKKLVALSLAAMVVALAAPALASTRRTYFGPAAGGVNNAGVEISARLSKGAPFQLTKFAWQNLVGSCSGGRPGATTDQFPTKIKVKDGKFHDTAKLSNGRTTVTVSGKFSHKNQRMAGKLRVRGPVAGCSSLDTGTVSWTAKQPAGQK
jgi:hypothetical protein